MQLQAANTAVEQSRGVACPGQNKLCPIRHTFEYTPQTSGYTPKASEPRVGVHDTETKKG